MMDLGIKTPNIDCVKGLEIIIFILLVIHKSNFRHFGQYYTHTREIALMIQLEQQQHREFWVVWWVGWVTDQLPISSSLGLDQKLNYAEIRNHFLTCFVNISCKLNYFMDIQ